MIDVVFGDSACGSLKGAQHYGEGDFGSGVIGVIFEEADGSQPTEDEIQAMQREVEKSERLKWENAVPMGGNPADVYGFELSLSIGDISEKIPGEKRRQVLEWLTNIYPNIDEDSAFTRGLMEKVNNMVEEICNRISSGESVRIWYSNNPDELCGMHWFIAQLNRLELCNNQIILVQLPDQETDGDGNFTIRSGWGGISPGEWHCHLHLQKVASISFCKGCAAHWQQLQQENAPLRAMLNGRLVSVPETIYDDFIIREIAAEADEFQEAMVIGRVLGKYELGVGDAWIAQRIESMICTGDLVPITEPAKGCPIYQRKLKKYRKI